MHVARLYKYHTLSLSIPDDAEHNNQPAHMMMMMMACALTVVLWVFLFGCCCCCCRPHTLFELGGSLIISDFGTTYFGQTHRFICWVWSGEEDAQSVGVYFSYESKSIFGARHEWPFRLRNVAIRRWDVVGWVGEKRENLQNWLLCIVCATISRSTRNMTLNVYDGSLWPVRVRFDLSRFMLFMELILM